MIHHLTRCRPDLLFVITTMTSAGRDVARRRLNGICQLAPFDYRAAVRSFVARIRPVLLIIAETELWPNFFFQSAAAGSRIALINARLSTHSMDRYRYIRPLLARALSNASVVLAQTNEDAERFCRLGVRAERIAVTGNAKYEVDGDSPPLRPELADFAPGQPVFIAGSTGPGEEQIVLDAFRKLAERFPSLALVLAPRHLQRIGEIERMLRGFGVTYMRASESTSAKESVARRTETADRNEIHLEKPVSLQSRGETEHRSPGSGCLERDERIPEPAPPGRYPTVLLLDTMGELAAFYRRASIAFIGGSLLPGRGGQSLAEPANAAVPTLFGPHYENHRQLADALLAAGAGRVVRDATQLADASAVWLADEEARVFAGRQARSVMLGLAGSTAATVRHLCALLPAP